MRFEISSLTVRKSFNICRHVHAQTRNSQTHKEKQCNLLQMPKSLTGGPIRENVRDMTYVWSVYRRECLEQQVLWQNNFVQWFPHCEIAEEAAAGGNGFLFDWQLERWSCHSQTLTVSLNMGRKRHRRLNERLKMNHYRWQHIQRTDRQTSCLWKDWIRWDVSILSPKNTWWYHGTMRVIRLLLYYSLTKMYLGTVMVSDDNIRVYHATITMFMYHAIFCW